MDELMLAQIRELLLGVANRLEDRQRDYPIQDRRSDAATLRTVLAKMK